MSKYEHFGFLVELKKFRTGLRAEMKVSNQSDRALGSVRSSITGASRTELRYIFR